MIINKSINIFFFQIDTYTHTYIKQKLKKSFYFFQSNSVCMWVGSYYFREPSTCYASSAKCTEYINILLQKKKEKANYYRARK